MSTIIISQATPSGAALLAACVRLWSETGQMDDMHVICDKDWTLTEPFWKATIPWLVGQAERGPDVLRVRHDAGVYSLERVSIPTAATLVLLRIPRDSCDIPGSLLRLHQLVQHFGPLNVLEILDTALGPCDTIEGLRTCQLSHPPLLSLRGIPSTEVLDLAGVFAASLYANEAFAFPFVEQALSLTTRVRGDMRRLLETLLNEGANALRGGLPAHCHAPELLREGDAILFPVRLSAEDAARLEPVDTYLEHILQSVLLADGKADWGISYIPVSDDGTQYKVVVAARYGASSMRRRLRQRLTGFPTALRWRFAPERPYYAMARLDAGRLRQMFTAVLPAFFPALDSALRTHALCERDRQLVAASLARLEPDAMPLSRGGTEIALDGPHPWTVLGDLSPTHPAVVAAACLLGPTHKQDHIRLFHDERERKQLCRLWHILKSEPVDRADKLEWRTFHAPGITEFCRAWTDLWNSARLPLPAGFDYSGQAQDWRDMSTLMTQASRLLAGDDVDDEFFEALQRLYGSPSSGRGPGDELFFALTPLLTAFYHAHSTSARQAFGGFWAPQRVSQRECLMWGPELTENVLRPLWDDLDQHAGTRGFLRMNVARSGPWLEMSLLTSGPGVDAERLQQGLTTRRGLATAAATIVSYGGQVAYRCRDRWQRYDGDGLVDESEPRPTTVRICLIGLPAIEPVVASNPHLVMVDEDDRPDILLSPSPVSPAPGWRAPCILISEDGAANVPSMSPSEAHEFVRALVGFEVVYRLQRLGHVTP